MTLNKCGHKILTEVIGFFCFFVYYYITLGYYPGTKLSRLTNLIKMEKDVIDERKKGKIE